jgi:hypothetical protein
VSAEKYYFSTLDMLLIDLSLHLSLYRFFSHKEELRNRKNEKSLLTYVINNISYTEKNKEFIYDKISSHRNSLSSK